MTFQMYIACLSVSLGRRETCATGEALCSDEQLWAIEARMLAIDLSPCTTAALETA